MLTSVRAIDQAIISSQDVNDTLQVLLNHVVTTLKVDAAAVMLYNQEENCLEFPIGSGFQNPFNPKLRIPIQAGTNNATGKGPNEAMLQNQLVFNNDLNVEARQAIFDMSGEHFATAGHIPLVARGSQQGLLSIFHRSHLYPDQEWFSFLEALAGQAAIALHNAELWLNVQRTNHALTLAYDRTIEGWVHALDLRDKETEGHTQRVTEMTMRLARLLRFNEEQLEHVRRGALLHDIGKIGVSDTILLKPGPLTEEEWQVMHKHPVYAYQMLSPIEFLAPAIDIPYCHHEWWNGKGYPRGLQGAQIPLPARIFAMVDAWDALRCDRPYRKAWPEDRVLAYLRT